MSASPEPCNSPDLALLGGFVREELDPETNRRVEEHVELCGACQEALEDIYRQDDGDFPTPNAVNADGESPVPPVPELDGYELGEAVGEGGMGVVYRARELSLNREVAVKVLRQDDAKGTLAARFVTEANIAGQLQHPCIPPVHRLGEAADGRPYLAMKLIKGQTLEDLLAGDIDIGRRVALFGKVCEGVAYAHSRDVIHRDIKPLNVMVGAFGEVQLMDWGLAKVLTDASQSDTDLDEPRTVIAAGDSDRTRAGSVMGTWSYMPPEQACGLAHRIDRRSDVFALGGVLCRMLTGLPTYAGDGVRRRAEEGDTADALARLDACDADPELVALAKRCLAANPAGRPADAGEVARDAAAYQSAVQAKLHEERVERERRQVRAAEQRKRRRVQATAFSLVAAVTAAGLFVGLHLKRQRERAEGDLQQRRRQAAWALAERRDGVEKALRAAAAALRAGDWPAARSALGRIDARLGNGFDLPKLRRAADRVRGDLKLGQDLESAWLKVVRQVTSSMGREDAADLGRLYRGLFDASGVRPLSGSPEEAAARLRPSRVRRQLIHALDAWMLVSAAGNDRARVLRLLSVAHAAEDDPLLKKVRTPKMLSDRVALVAALSEADPNNLSPILLALPAAVPEIRSSGLTVLRDAQRERPSDFWLNFVLGHVLYEDDPSTAVGHFRAAVAARPIAEAYAGLSQALLEAGQVPDAVAAARRAVELDGKSAYARRTLALALLESGDPGARRDALAEAEAAVKLSPREAGFRVTLSWALIRADRYRDAAATARRAIKLDPKEVTARVNLVEALFKAGDAANALREAAAASAVEPPDAGQLRRLAELLEGRSEHAAEVAARRAVVRAEPESGGARAELAWGVSRSGRDRDALAAACEAVRLAPDDAECLNALACMLGNLGRYGEALPHSRRAAELAPRAGHVQGSLCWLLTEAGEAAGAVAAGRLAVRLNPDLAFARVNLALALAAAGDQDAAQREAAEVLKQPGLPPGQLRRLFQSLCESGSYAVAADLGGAAAKAFPNDANIRANWAWSLMQSGRLQEALRPAREAVDLADGDGDCLNTLACALGNLGRFPEAIRYSRKAAAASPKAGYVRGTLCWLLNEAGEYSDAVRAGWVAVRLDPTHAVARLNLIEALFGIGDRAAALTEASTILKMPSFPAGQLGRLRDILYNQGECAAAADAGRRAVALAPYDADARLSLADALIELGRDAEAAAMAWRAVELAPRAPLSHHMLAYALINLGRPAEAVRHAREAARLDPEGAATRVTLACALLGAGDPAAPAEAWAAMKLTSCTGDDLSRLGRALLRRGQLLLAAWAYSLAAAR